MESNEKTPQPLMQKEDFSRPRYEMREGIMHITFRQPQAYVIIGKQKFALDEGPAIVVAGKKIPVGKVF